MLSILGVAEVNGHNFDVLTEQDSTASVVGNVKVIREALVLERNHISPQCLVEVQDSSTGCRGVSAREAILWLG